MDALDNLVKIKKLQKEPPDNHEIDGMLASAQDRLTDAQQNLSKSSKFMLAYGAAHALALAALRWHGYRSDSRFIVFQCLQHTVGMSAADWRVFDLCHKRRNLAEYEGHLEIDDALLVELIQKTAELMGKVLSLGPIDTKE